MMEDMHAHPQSRHPIPPHSPPPYTPPFRPPLHRHGGYSAEKTKYDSDRCTPLHTPLHIHPHPNRIRLTPHSHLPIHTSPLPSRHGGYSAEKTKYDDAAIRAVTILVQACVGRGPQTRRAQCSQRDWCTANPSSTDKITILLYYYQHGEDGGATPTATSPNHTAQHGTRKKNVDTAGRDTRRPSCATPHGHWPQTPGLTRNAEGLNKKTDSPAATRAITTPNREVRPRATTKTNKTGGDVRPESAARVGARRRRSQHKTRQQHRTRNAQQKMQRNTKRGSKKQQ